MSIFEYDKEKEEKKLRKAERECGREEGLQQGLQEGLKEGLKSLAGIDCKNECRGGDADQTATLYDPEVMNAMAREVWNKIAGDSNEHPDFWHENVTMTQAMSVFSRSAASNTNSST